MKRILYITHFFPPTGGAGVQRSSKFAKFLPENGVLPVVVTRGMNSRDRWSPEDRTLLSDIPSEVPIYRAEWNRQEAGGACAVG